MNFANLLTASMYGLQATFFKGPNPVFNKDNLTELQDFYTVSHVDLDWGDQSPGTDIPKDNFSAVFEGKLVADQPGTKSYTLYLNTGNDEGVRLYIGNKKIIDTWNGPKTGELKTKISLTGGKAEDIRLEYKEGKGNAKLKLEWETEELAREVIPKQNFVRHGYGAVDESDLLTIRVAKNGRNNIDVIETPTQADHEKISQQTFASIQNAVDQAEALMNTGQGVKILIAPGEYRVSDYGNFGIVLGDQNAFNNNQFDLNNQGRQAPLVIEGTAPGVRILGSQRWQDGWQSLGNGVYKHEWTKNWGFEVPQNGLPPSDPVTHRREVVFVKGKRLNPVLFQAATYDSSSKKYTFGKKLNPTQDLKQGQFTVDEEGNALYIKLHKGSNINDKIEVAQAEQLFRAHEPKHNLVLRNLEFAHAANRYARQYAFAAVDIGAAHWRDLEQSQNIVIDNVSINNNSGAGLRLSKVDNITVRNSNFRSNGASGIATKRLNGALMNNINAQYNNWRGDLGNFRGWFVAGIKNADTKNFTADNFNASQNYAHGFWHDINVKNTLFANSIVEENKRHGLFIEVSDGPHQIINSISRNNGETGVLINTSPNVFLQGNYIENNGRNVANNKGDSEVRLGARTDREANEPKLPDIIGNITLIDNIIQNDSNSSQNELIEKYADFKSYENLVENELLANHNVYWDKIGAPPFELRHNKRVRFAKVDSQGESWLKASQRDNFEVGSVFEKPKTGTSKPIYTGSFSTTVTKGNQTILTSKQLAVSDPDTYAFDLNYTLANTPEYGSLRLRGVRLGKNDTFSFADVERGWVSYTHEATHQKDDVLTLQAGDDTSVLAPRNLALTIGEADSLDSISQVPQPEETPEVPTPTVPDLSNGSNPPLFEPRVIGEYGTLLLNQQWQTVALNNDFINPVVIVSDPTFNGADPVSIRLQKVDGDSFQLRLQEPKYEDGNHTKESVSYVVLEAGDWTFADGTRISAGTQDSSRLTSKGFERVDLTAFSNTPTVFTQVQTFKGRDWVTTRIRDQSEQGFQLAMQEEEELNKGGHVSETLGWLAIEQGTAVDGDTLIQGGTTEQTVNHKPLSIQFGEAFDIAPSVIAKLGSYYGADTANLRLENLGTASFSVRVHEEKSLDKELGHTNESISFLALEGSSGILTGFDT